MKQLEGFELVEFTKDRIVQRQTLGETGAITVTGNPDPPKEEQQKRIDAVAGILYKGYVRAMREKEGQRGE